MVVTLRASSPVALACSPSMPAISRMCAVFSSMVPFKAPIFSCAVAVTERPVATEPSTLFMAALNVITSLWSWWMRSWISSVARAVWLDSPFTSAATTAKPLPASPARAASMVAFNASRLVCRAMASMVATISPI
jgi:hypothetical protein